MGEQKRTYLVHVPKGYDPKTPTPVVLALHGAAMNGLMMVWFSGHNKTSDKEGFIVVYLSGTGTGPFQTWNAGGFKGKTAEGKADDVAFVGKLLDASCASSLSRANAANRRGLVGGGDARDCLIIGPLTPGGASRNPESAARSAPSRFTASG